MRKRKNELCSVRVFFKRGKEKKIREIILHDIDYDNTSRQDYCKIIGAGIEGGLRAERIIEKS
jgi:hypothetical protein